MFGYIMPYKDELKVREYRVFKGYYCGLCKTLGREFNQIVRLGLNYDLTFLALLLSSLENKRDKLKGEACISNPFKKKTIIQQNNSLKYTSYISVILIYFKLIDDWRDEKSIPSLLASIPYILPVKKAKKTYEDKYDIIKHYLNQLIKLEKNNCEVIDESANTFAKIMEEIAVAPFIIDEKEIRILKWLGYNMGRWIYILDAFNDIEKDIKEKNYNPILLQYKYNKSEDIEEFKSRIRDSIEFTLTFTLDNIAKSFELLDIKQNKEIIENIIYIGTRHKMNKILRKGVVINEKSL
ncbi:hypothetical protein BET03_11865 [Thermohalobacter berrensis]|uniref:Uncharacterized protein n=1 Tax=Thermohalobacter berrensis TaxID=99594 RepID=A0A419T354_9FIRM|nr:hypothetical protein BET03_11865 [Thermohalobacter berrensis]